MGKLLNYISRAWHYDDVVYYVVQRMMIKTANYSSNFRKLHGMFKIIETFSLEDSKTFTFCDKTRSPKRIQMQNSGYFQNFIFVNDENPCF